MEAGVFVKRSRPAVNVAKKINTQETKNNELFDAILNTSDHFLRWGVKRRGVTLRDPPDDRNRNGLRSYRQPWRTSRQFFHLFITFLEAIV